MAEIAQVEHRIENRLRLRIASRRGDPGYFEEVAAHLSEFDEVREVLANPVTGSVLLHLNGSPNPLLDRARERGLFKFGNPRPNSGQKAADAARSSLSITPLSAGLVALALLQLGRGEVIGPAAEAFWNARIARTSLNAPWLAALFFAAGLYQLANGRVLGSAASLLVYALTLQELDRAPGRSSPGADKARRTPAGPPEG